MCSGVRGGLIQLVLEIVGGKYSFIFLWPWFDLCDGLRVRPETVLGSLRACLAASKLWYYAECNFNEFAAQHQEFCNLRDIWHDINNSIAFTISASLRLSPYFANANIRRVRQPNGFLPQWVDHIYVPQQCSSRDCDSSLWPCLQR